MALNSNPLKAVAYLGGDEGGCVRRRSIMELPRVNAGSTETD
jgi:hypothetical protein